MNVALGEVEDGAADHDIGECVRKGHGFDVFQPEVVCRESWRDGCAEVTRGLERAWIRIHSKDFETLPEQVDKVSSRAAAGIEYPHSGRDAPTEKLIE